MITSLLFLIVVGVLIVLILLSLAKRWTLELAYVRICFVPLVLLLFVYIFKIQLTRQLSYAVMLLPLSIGFFSFILGVIGIFLIISHKQRKERYQGLMIATIVASVPAGILLVLVLWIFARPSITPI